MICPAGKILASGHAPCSTSAARSITRPTRTRARPNSGSKDASGTDEHTDSATLIPPFTLQPQAHAGTHPQTERPDPAHLSHTPSCARQARQRHWGRVGPCPLSPLARSARLPAPAAFASPFGGAGVGVGGGNACTRAVEAMSETAAVSGSSFSVRGDCTSSLGAIGGGATGVFVLPTGEDAGTRSFSFSGVAAKGNEGDATLSFDPALVVRANMPLIRSFADSGPTRGTGFSSMTVSSMPVGAPTFRSADNFVCRYFASFNKLQRNEWGRSKRSHLNGHGPVFGLLIWQLNLPVLLGEAVIDRCKNLRHDILRTETPSGSV